MELRGGSKDINIILYGRRKNLTIIIEKDYVKKCFQLKLTYLISLAILKKKF